MSNDKSYVGMSNCYVCGEPSCVLLDRRLQPTLERNMGPTGPDDLCHVCEEKAKTMACIVGVTEAAIAADRDRMREISNANDREGNPYKKRRVFPYPARADSLLPWIKLSVLDKVLEGGAAKWMVGPVMFADVQARNQMLQNLTGTPTEEILAAAEKAGPGVDIDAATLRKGAEKQEEA